MSFVGATKQSVAQAVTGRTAVRNHCAQCGGLVFGGRVGKESWHTIYAGSLDQPALFRPQVAIFVRDKPSWVLIPAGVAQFETMPGRS